MADQGDQGGTVRYRQIVAEVRRRIETGELGPGERIPSTREITRQWGVAMATATKVLTELRREGLVRAVPGVGTVVAARPARAARRPAATARVAAPGAAVRAAPEQSLTAARITAVAVAVADTEGLAAVSMRRVAAELGTATMSLYRHVTDKEHLLLLMLDAACAEWSLPDDPPEGWRERLELAARTLWAGFRRHPWLAPALSVTRPQPVASALPYTEWVLAALEGRGLDPSAAMTTHLALFNYIRGTAVSLETEAEAEAASGMSNEEWLGTQEHALNAVLATGRFPRLERLIAAGYDFDLDALFESGLQRLLAGIAVLLSGGEPGP